MEWYRGFLSGGKFMLANTTCLLFNVFLSLRAFIFTLRFRLLVHLLIPFVRRVFLSLFRELVLCLSRFVCLAITRIVIITATVNTNSTNQQRRKKNAKNSINPFILQQATKKGREFTLPLLCGAHAFNVYVRIALEFIAPPFCQQCCW